MDKKELRTEMRRLKKQLDDNKRRQAAASVFASLEQCPEFKQAEHILLYYSLPDELSTPDFIEKWHDRKHIYLPRVCGDDLEILPYDRASMEQGAYNIEEPQGDDLVDVERLQLIVVPAMAYDAKGDRLGRGKGYYDRLLSRTKAVKVGICYDFQLVDDIPTEPHDVRVDFVICESATIRTVDNG
jgi:5-formyltetrahydrofolate cyclo-ligase